jgi:hypothetical protein
MGVVTDAVPDEGGGDTSPVSGARANDTGSPDPFLNEFDLEQDGFGSADAVANGLVVLKLLGDLL